MTRPLALLRPEPGWSASAAAARALGIAVIGHPLSEARPLDWAIPEARYDALLVGSGAVFRLGGEAVRDFRHLPVHAVGEATAQAARAAGFTVARVGEGGLQHLLDAEAGRPRAFLRLGGEERVPLAVHSGQTVREIAVYRMITLPLAPDFADDLRARPAVIALHSAATARHFARECARLEISPGSHDLVAIGGRVAAAAGAGWGSVQIAERPTASALLAKAATLCK